jgi:hypothetical protein
VNPAILFTAATSSYLANCTVGAAVASGALDTSDRRWVHHALYVLTCALGAAAVSSLAWSRSRAGLVLLPAAVPLALIPRFGARTRRHPIVALSAAPFFVLSLVAAWRR